MNCTAGLRTRIREGRVPFHRVATPSLATICEKASEGGKAQNTAGIYNCAARRKQNMPELYNRWICKCLTHQRCPCTGSAGGLRSWTWLPAASAACWPPTWEWSGSHSPSLYKQRIISFFESALKKQKNGTTWEFLTSRSSYNHAISWIHTSVHESIKRDLWFKIFELVWPKIFNKKWLLLHNGHFILQFSHFDLFKKINHQMKQWQWVLVPPLMLKFLPDTTPMSRSLPGLDFPGPDAASFFSVLKV